MKEKLKEKSPKTFQKIHQPKTLLQLSNLNKGNSQNYNFRS